MAGGFTIQVAASLTDLTEKEERQAERAALKAAKKLAAELEGVTSATFHSVSLGHVDISPEE